MAGLTVDQLQVLITSDTSGLKKGLNETKSQMSGLSASTSQFSAKSAAAFAAVTSVITVGLNKAMRVIGDTMGTAISRVDTLNNSARTFNNMGFDTDKSEKAIEALNTSILGLPTSLDSGIRGMTSLAATYGDVDKGQKVFSALNNAILGFGGSASEVDNAILQLSQVPMNGPLDAQTWRSLRNSGLTPVLVAMSKDMGVSVDVLKSKLGEGDLTVKDFTDRLIKMDKDGGGGMKSLAQIAQDSTKGIGTGFANAKTAVARGIANIIQSVGSPRISQVIKDFGAGFEATLQSVADAVPLVLKEIKPLLNGIQDFAKKAQEVGQQVFNYLMPSIIELYKTIKNDLAPAISNAVTKMQPFINAIGGSIVFAVKALIEAVKVAVGIVTGFINFISSSTFTFGLFAGGIMTVVAALAIYKTAIAVSSAVTTAYTAATVALSAVQAIQAQGIGFLRSAWIALNLTMAANPIGLVVSAVAALIGVITILSATTDTQTGRTSDLKTAQDKLKASTDLVKDAENSVSDARLARTGADLAVRRAQERLTELKNSDHASTLDLEEAEYNLAVAKDSAKDAANREKDAIDKSKVAKQQERDDAASVVRANDAVKDSAQRAANAYYNYASNVQKARDEIRKTQAAGGTVSSSTQLQSAGIKGINVPHRAGGGPVKANNPYFVGDNKDGSLNSTSELFVPKSPGRIVNSSDLRSMLGGTSRFSGATINMNTNKMISKSNGSMSSSSRSSLAKEQQTQTLQPIIVKIGEDTLINKVVKGINSMGYMNNETVLEV